MARIPISTEQAPAAIGPYSQAVRKGGMLFFSGQIPLDPATGQLVEGDIARRRGACSTTCARSAPPPAGSFDDVVRVGIYLTDLGDFAAVNAVMRRTSRRHSPRVRRSRCPACRAAPASKWTPSSAFD
jgi:reactive intermediate/imine deaminase